MLGSVRPSPAHPTRLQTRSLRPRGGDHGPPSRPAWSGQSRDWNQGHGRPELLLSWPPGGQQLPAPEAPHLQGAVRGSQLELRVLPCPLPSPTSAGVGGGAGWWRGLWVLPPGPLHAAAEATGPTVTWAPCAPHPMGVTPMSELKKPKIWATGLSFYTGRN